MNKQGKNHVLYYTLSIIGCIVYVALIVSVSVMVVKIVSQNGTYPAGSDTMYHIYRGDYVYNSIRMETGIHYTIICGITALSL